MKKLIMIGARFEAFGGMSSVVNVYRESGLFDRFPIVNIPVHCEGNTLAKAKIMLIAYGQFLRLLMTNQVGLLHAHVASRGSFWRKSVFFISAFLFGVPTILHLHGGGFAVFYQQECGNLGKWFIRQIFNKVSRVVVLSATWQAWVKSISTNPYIEVIYNPVLLPAKIPNWELRKPGTVLFLGKICQQKGIYDLLQAVEKISIEHPELQLWLGGEGEIQQAQRYAADLGITNHVKLLGWIKGDDKSRYLSEAMIYVLPSYKEGFPMSLLEAMAVGLPVLSTPVGGIPEAITQDVEGFLVEPGNVEGLAKRLSELLSDCALAQRMGIAGRHKIEACCSSHEILPRLERLYVELGVSPISAY